MLFKHLCHSESPYTGHTKDGLWSHPCSVQLENGSLSIAVMCKKPAREGVCDKCLRWNANPKKTCDTLSTDGNQPWGWGCLGSAQSTVLVLPGESSPRDLHWAELCRCGNHQSLAPGRGAIRWMGFTNMPVLLLDDLSVWSLLNDANMHFRTNFLNNFLEN